MNTSRLVGVLLGAIALGGSRMTAQNPAGAAAELRITIYDQAHLSAEVVGTALDRLRRIFRQSGVAIELVGGDPAADEASLFTYMRLPPRGHEHEAACRARHDIALKISDASVPSVPETVLGISSPLTLTGLNVRIYNQHVRAAAFRHARPYPIVLSYAIAHEIGHVLLRSNDHNNWGLMSSVWTDREYAQMTEVGTMFFTSDESRRMLMNLGGMGCRNRIGGGSRNGALVEPTLIAPGTVPTNIPRSRRALSFAASARLSKEGALSNSEVWEDMVLQFSTAWEPGGSTQLYRRTSKSTEEGRSPTFVLAGHAKRSGDQTLSRTP